MAVVTGLNGFHLFPQEKASVVEVSVQPETEINEAFLVVSPYHAQPHLLDLRSLDTAEQILAKALVGLKCLRDDYATADYRDSFNWSEVVSFVRDLAHSIGATWKERIFYIVVFRSQIPPTTHYDDLGKLDKAAHAEAMQGGGFLKYWFGSPDHDGRNLATCIWRSQTDARTGSSGPAHRRAAGAARSLYSEWKIERLNLVIGNDAIDFEIKQWID